MHPQPHPRPSFHSLIHISMYTSLHITFGESHLSSRSSFSRISSSSSSHCCSSCSHRRNVSFYFRIALMYILIPEWIYLLCYQRNEWESQCLWCALLSGFVVFVFFVVTESQLWWIGMARYDDGSVRRMEKSASCWSSWSWFSYKKKQCSLFTSSNK